MKFEHMSEPVLPFRRYFKRVLHSARLALIVAVAMLLLGILGYHYLGDMSFVDALLEAAMILGGMGPVAPMHSDSVKIFASFYALASGLFVIGTTGFLLAPWLHRMLHKFYQAEGDAPEAAAPAAKSKRRSSGKKTTKKAAEKPAE